jgi:predicted Abi (CAAX) family protease
MTAYLKNNLLAGLKKPSRDGFMLSLLLTIGYSFIALVTGFTANLFKVGLVESKFLFLLPLSLLIFPSLLEEAFFRGVLIPNNTKEKGYGSIVFYTLLSTFVFLLWHPLGALTINPVAREIFLNPSFLFIVFCLGLVCSLSYIYSRSLWWPIAIHWLTVLLWVLFLGGHNLVLA